MKWKRAGKKIEVPIGDYLENLILTEKTENQEWQVCIGTDSHRNCGHYKFATVILIIVRENMGDGIIVGRGGKIIESTYNINFNKKNKDSINERMLTEVSKSLEIATIIDPILNKHNIKMEIHADINPDPKWESHKVMNQVIGYILGMGYEFKIKPKAFASSNCGDRYCK